MAKKKISNVATLDLRNYSANALREIKSIESVATIIAAEGDEEYNDAFSSIKLKNVANTIYMPKGKKLVKMNGKCILTDSLVEKGAYYFLNGISVVYGLSEESDISVFSNGILLVQRSSKVNILKTNGINLTEDFNGEDIKIFSNDVVVDCGFVNEAKKGTFVFSGNDITIENDVTADMLREKEIRFIAGNDIYCSKKILGYVGNNSTIGNEIETEED